MKTNNSLLVLIALVSVALCGCGNNNSATENTPAATNSPGSQMTPGTTNQSSAGNAATNSSMNNGTK